MPDKPTVYIETSVVSYLTSRPSCDALTAARQEKTRQWWQDERRFFTLLTSQVTVDEASRGDADEAGKRLNQLHSIPLLRLTAEAANLSTSIIEQSSLPQDAVDDASHIAIAVVHRVEYLLTWNIRHIANAQVHAKVRRICKSLSYDAPLICTPEELLAEH